MSNEVKELTPQEALVASFPERERKAYDYFCKSDQASVAPSTNAKFFALFLAGKTVAEIHRLNSNLSLGQVVAARIQGDWDRRRVEYMDELLKGAADRQVQSQLESIEFLQDMLAVLKKRDGDKYRLYLQTGDESHLNGTLQINSIDAIKKVVEAIQKLQGTEQTVHVIKSETTAAPAEPKANAHAALKLVTGGK